MEDIQLLKKKKGWYKRWWGILILVFLIIFFILSSVVVFLAGKRLKQMYSGVYVEKTSGFDMALLTDDFSPSWGEDDAPIIIVEFADFNCPLCFQAEGALAEIKDKYGDKIKFYWRHYPVVRESSFDLALAGICANRQEKFWEYAKEIFARQGTMTPGNIEPVLELVGVDLANYQNCLNHPLTMAQLRKDFFAAEDGFVRGTPTFFINGNKIEGAIPLETWEELINSFLE